jgi:hypothetical protein
MWCLPRLTPQFRARMDDVLTLYTEPLPAGEEVHCFDETPKQLLGTPRGLRNPKPGKSRRIGYDTPLVVFDLGRTRIVTGYQTGVQRW